MCADHEYKFLWKFMKIFERDEKKELSTEHSKVPERLELQIKKDIFIWYLSFFKRNILRNIL